MKLFALGVAGKPSPFHTFALFKKFMNAPKTGKPDNTQQTGQNGIGHETGTCDAEKPCNEKNGPRPCAEIVLGLDDNRVKQPDGKERTEADKQAG